MRDFNFKSLSSLMSLRGGQFEFELKDKEIVNLMFNLKLGNYVR